MIKKKDVSFQNKDTRQKRQQKESNKKINEKGMLIKTRKVRKCKKEKKRGASFRTKRKQIREKRKTPPDLQTILKLLMSMEPICEPRRSSPGSVHHLRPSLAVRQKDRLRRDVRAQAVMQGSVV